MVARPLLVLLCVSVSAAACVAPSPAPVVDIPPQASPNSPGAGPRPFPAMTGQAGAAWIPWAEVSLNNRPLGSAPHADIQAGQGWAVRGGRYDDALGFEGVFATTTHDESNTGAELTTWAFYADLTTREELWRGPVSAWAGFGFGFGLIRFDWDRAYKSETTALWQGEGIFALQLGPNVALEARAMAVFAGHPTRTAGWGGLAMLGGSLAF